MDPSVIVSILKGGITTASLVALLTTIVGIGVGIVLYTAIMNFLGRRAQRLSIVHQGYTLQYPTATGYVRGKLQILLMVICMFSFPTYTMMAQLNWVSLKKCH